MPCCLTNSIYVWQDQLRGGFRMLRDNKEIYGVIEGRWVLEIDPRMSIVLVKLPMPEKKLKQLKSSVVALRAQHYLK